ncbi:MAG: hypothetical protein PHS44_07270, partial [Candidatus Dojkabacteria bacterium]|nr:hypothetical protein [Candidatus Dojkabacteria bacterium]
LTRQIYRVSIVPSNPNAETEISIVSIVDPAFSPIRDPWDRPGFQLGGKTFAVDYIPENPVSYDTATKSMIEEMDEIVKTLELI